VSTILATVHDVAPDSAISMLKDPLEKFAASPSVGYALVVGILISIWATSSYVAAFGRAMNRIYEVPEGRPIWKLKPFTILVALVVLVLSSITVAALALTEPVADGISQALGLSAAPSLVLTVVKWPAMVLAVVLIVAVLYYVTPNARRPGFRVTSAGAMGAVIVLVLVSLAFAFYVANFAHYDRTYSVFAGIVVVLIWIWIANLTLLCGAEFDIQYERARELEHGLDADAKIFVTPRDTEVSDRNVLKRRKETADAEAIRRASRSRR
jgi:membrane protein